jgi:hypothetical protein
MNIQSNIGIDSTVNNEWIAVLWTEGKITLSRPFKNTHTDLAALVCFITEHSTRAKICLKPSHPDIFTLLNLISTIPDVEVMLMSDAGFKMHKTWLLKSSATSLLQNSSSQAHLLACCAERMV